MTMCVCALAYAQATDTIRYVHPSGIYTNNGRSWEKATNNLQDAINDLRDYLKTNSLTSGSVYVAAGTYIPSESTESSGGSMLNTSFKIYAGIHVYGGFNPDAPEEKQEYRMMVNDKMCKDNWADPTGYGTTSGDVIASQWDLKYKTILTGNHSGSDVVFSFDSIRGRFNTTFPASSYHVVWFATNGKYETGNDTTAGHYRPLEYPASVDGCVISCGNASTRTTTSREHTAYGGGAYMVGNSELRNCTVERCYATLRGGGIYMDGGGTAEFCYVHTCQSAGVGVVEGYGGGVCIEYEGALGHSHITNCAARCGGGLLIYHVAGEYPEAQADTVISNYSPYATACVINNNTASAEGGGVYLAEGGSVNHCTVTANSCVGPDVTYYGRRHGRTGGVYIRNCGMLFNSVFWGNRCATNNDIQFASVRQTAGEDYDVFVYHCAFMNHDISDWTGVTKEVVFSLDKHNFPPEGASGNYPCFFEPTVDPFNWAEPSYPVPGPGVFMRLSPEDFPGPRVWHLTSYSALDEKGVQANNTVLDASPWLLHAHTDYGVVSNPFEPVPTLGALVRKPDPLTYALVPQQGVEGRLSGDPIPTLFIDPNRKGVFEDGIFIPQDHEGNSWDTPIKDMGEAISYFRKFLVDDDGYNHHYYIPVLDENGNETGDSARYDYVQFLVKEGTLTTAGHGNYLDNNIRSAAVRVDSHMRLYGGYPTSLTGTNTAGRNPRDYVTKITANITGLEGARAYDNNSAHVIAMVNVEHCIVDGFTLTEANTHNVYLSNSAHAGGGILINNGTTPQEKRIHMTGNQVRNCVISNCSSEKGAAIYVNGEYMNADGYVCYAELKLVNCMVRNNTADYEDNEHNLDDHGVITANGRAYIEVEHCDMLNNVGYPFKADSKTTETDEPITCTHSEHSGHAFHGFIRVNNSIIFCNGAEPTGDRSQLGTDLWHAVLSVFPDGQDYVFGEYNMFDNDLQLYKADPLQPHGFFNPDFSYSVPSDFIPSTVDITRTFGVSLLADLDGEKHNLAIFTRTDPSASTYPAFVNPSRNVGHSESGDKPLYGGKVSFEPLATNPCVNAAGSDYADAENYDRSDNEKRTHGGAPDIGAIENRDLPAAGMVIYVTPEGAGKRDGSSWSNAIEGNAVYRLYGAGAATGDSIDAANNARLVNLSTGEPVLTTDIRYCGGYAQSYFTSSKTGVVTETTVTNAWVTEDTIFVGGPRAGEKARGRENEFEETSNTNVINAGTTEPGFVAGWDDDTRYPYGEISGASRSFWRANPYHSKTSWTTSGYDDRQVFIDSCRTKGWINNTHRENYVSGLQWAVEEAARRNHAATRLEGEVYDTIVQVWVGAGKYTDYKGFIMRDSVTVYGGFPAGKYSAPSMTERQALMSDVVNIPKSLPAKDFEARDYETLLQISDVNPIAPDTTLNPDAIKFQDNDLSRSFATDTRSYAYKTKHITNTYTFTQNKTNNTTK